MVDNLLRNLKTDSIYRIDVNFKITDKTIDNAIGRAAHIRFLESDPLTKMFITCLEDFFK